MHQKGPIDIKQPAPMTERPRLFHLAVVLFCQGGTAVFYYGRSPDKGPIIGIGQAVVAGAFEMVIKQTFVPFTEYIVEGDKMEALPCQGMQRKLEEREPATFVAEKRIIIFGFTDLPASGIISWEIGKSTGKCTAVLGKRPIYISEQLVEFQ